MSIRGVTVKEMVDEWEAHPSKLYAWLIRLIWEAGITPEESIIWRTENGKITIQNMNSVKYDGSKEKEVT